MVLQSNNHQNSSVVCFQKQATLLNWIKTFEYPHCQQTTSFAQLRSGIALCQIVYDLILGRAQPDFLSKVIISNPSTESCINNIAHARSYFLSNTTVVQGQSFPKVDQIYHVPIQKIRLQQTLIYNIQNETAMVEFVEALYRQVGYKNRPSDLTDHGTGPRISDLSTIHKRPPLPRSSLKSRQKPEPQQFFATSTKQDSYEEPSIQQKAQQNLKKSTITQNSQASNQQKQRNNSVSLRTQRIFSAYDAQEKQLKGTTNKKPLLKSRQSNETESDEEGLPNFNTADRVDYSTKVLLCQWLDQIHLVKYFPSIQERLASICKDGTVFIDLINWLNGRQPILSQAAKHFSQQQTTQATYRKVLNYLSGFQRMNTRYLLCAKELAQGSPDHFWGLLDDIYHLHHNRISRFDRRYELQSGQQGVKVETQSTKRGRSSRITTKNTRHIGGKSDSGEDEQEYQLVRQPVKQQAGNPSSSSRRSNYKTILTEQRQSLKVLNKAEADKQRQSGKENQMSNSSKPSALNSSQVNQILIWLREYGFSYMLEKASNCTDSDILKNPIRNGILLGSLVMKLQLAKVNIIKEPADLKQVIRNFDEITRNCAHRALCLPALVSPFPVESVFCYIRKLKQTYPKPAPKLQQSRQIPISHNSNSNQYSVPISSRFLVQSAQPQSDYLSKQAQTWVKQVLGVDDIRQNFTKIAVSVIKVDVCRETTPKIRQQNISKIINYLKKIGFVKYLEVTLEDILNPDKTIIYSIVEDLYLLRSIS